jgi:hypothetical protein
MILPGHEQVKSRIARESIREPFRTQRFSKNRVPSIDLAGLIHVDAKSVDLGEQAATARV